MILLQTCWPVPSPRPAQRCCIQNGSGGKLLAVYDKFDRPENGTMPFAPEDKNVLSRKLFGHEFVSKHCRESLKG